MISAQAFTFYEVGSNVGGGGGALDMFASFGGVEIRVLWQPKKHLMNRIFSGLTRRIHSSITQVGVKYQRRLYDATFIPWEKALEVLCTNEPRRTDSVTMVFERPVDE